MNTKLISVICSLAILCTNASCTSEQAVTDANELIKRKGLIYQGEAETPFSGAVINYFFQSERAKARFHVKDGLMDGGYVSYYENGQESVRATYRAGKLHGLEETYCKNGQLGTTVEYRDGKREGPMEEFFCNGLVALKTGFKNGLEEGPYEKYDMNGMLSKSGAHVGGKQHGEWWYARAGFVDRNKWFNCVMGECTKIDK